MSPVVLAKLQISTESSSGRSVTGSCQRVPLSSMSMRFGSRLMYSRRIMRRVFTDSDSGMRGMERRVAGTKGPGTEGLGTRDWAAVFATRNCINSQD